MKRRTPRKYGPPPDPIAFRDYLRECLIADPSWRRGGDMPVDRTAFTADELQRLYDASPDEED
jgi:hypothetical protein